jgi:hypothetical protein
MPRGKTNNRTDLNLPNVEAEGQQYGKATDQRNAQRAVPMAASPGPSAPEAPISNQVQTPFQEPGSLPYMHPTNRPDEPVTAGMDFGPGIGSEALAAPLPTLADNLAQYAGQSSTVDQLASTARSLGL